MSQTVTFSISAEVEKGPKISSPAKFPISNYIAVIEEMICKCSPKEFDFPTCPKDEIEMLVVASDRYENEKECPLPASGKNGKHVYINLCTPTDEKSFHPLLRPLVLAGSSLTCDLKTISVRNELTSDVKLSILVMRKAK